jgi:hypothetical protein
VRRTRGTAEVAVDALAADADGGIVASPHGSPALQDIVLRCVSLLCLDRFADFSDDAGGVASAPVRDIASLALALAAANLPPAGATAAVDVLASLAACARGGSGGGSDDWHARHGAALGMRALGTALRPRKVSAAVMREEQEDGGAGADGGAFRWTGVDENAAALSAVTRVALSLVSDAVDDVAAAAAQALSASLAPPTPATNADGIVHALSTRLAITISAGDGATAPLMDALRVAVARVGSLDAQSLDSAANVCAALTAGGAEASRDAALSACLAVFENAQGSDAGREWLRERGAPTLLRAAWRVTLLEMRPPDADTAELDDEVRKEESGGAEDDKVRGGGGRARKGGAAGSSSAVAEVSEVAEGFIGGADGEGGAAGDAPAFSDIAASLFPPSLDMYETETWIGVDVAAVEAQLGEADEGVGASARGDARTRTLNALTLFRRILHVCAGMSTWRSSIARWPWVDAALVGVNSSDGDVAWCAAAMPPWSAGPEGDALGGPKHAGGWLDGGGGLTNAGATATVIPVPMTFAAREAAATLIGELLGSGVANVGDARGAVARILRVSCAVGGAAADADAPRFPATAAGIAAAAAATRALIRSLVRWRIACICLLVHGCTDHMTSLLRPRSTPSFTRNGEGVSTVQQPRVTHSRQPLPPSSRSSQRA